jgi:hypothetical protein
MELQVTKVTTEQEQSVMAYIICQRFAAFTKGSPVGTSNLLNCMGIVIHNTVGRVGVVAHVEAQTSTEHYNAVVDKVLKALIDKLNSYVDIGRFSVVLLGNAGGIIVMRSFVTELKKAYISRRVPAGSMK